MAGPFIGPRGGKWADAKHTIHWDPHNHHAKGEIRRHDIEIHPAIRGEKTTVPFYVMGIGNGKVSVSRHKDAEYGPEMSEESFRHMKNDLAGKVDLPGHPDPRIDAVVSGRAKLLGKGDDGLAFRVGDDVVKVSTTVPYVPENPGHRTPKEAVEMLRKQAEVGNKLADMGIDGVQRSEFIVHGDKGFQIKPWMEIPEKWSRPDLDRIQEIVRKIHDAGYAVKDSIQAGRDPKTGKILLFDIGKAARITSDDSIYGDVASDNDSLRNLYEESGERYVSTRLTTGEKNLDMLNEHWGEWRSKGAPNAKFMRRHLDRVVKMLRDEAQARYSGKDLEEAYSNIEADTWLLEAQLSDLEKDAKKVEKALAIGDTLDKSRKLHGRMKWNGIDISIENRKGSVRRWYDPHDKRHGETKMLYPYGYIRRTKGADGEHVDVYVGPDENADRVYVIHQRKAPDFKRYDEDKVMLGFSSRGEAKRAYLAHYDDDRFFGSMTSIPSKKFVDDAKSGRMRSGREISKATSVDRPPVGSMGFHSPPGIVVGDRGFVTPVDIRRRNVRTKTRIAEDNMGRVMGWATGHVDGSANPIVVGTSRPDVDVASTMAAFRREAERKRRARRDVWPRLVIRKSEQLSLFGAPKKETHLQGSNQLSLFGGSSKPRPKKKTGAKLPGMPPGAGWKRTPNGWSRGHGATYEWASLNWTQEDLKNARKNAKGHHGHSVQVGADGQREDRPRQGHGEVGRADEKRDEGETRKKRANDTRKSPAIAVHQEFLPPIDPLARLSEDVEWFPHPYTIMGDDGKPKGKIERLYPHQKDAAERILNSWLVRDGFLLSDEAGLGKTNAALAALVQNGGKRNLIVVPTSGKEGLMAQWSGPTACGLYGITPKRVDEMSDDDGWYMISYDELMRKVRDPETGEDVLDSDGSPVFERRSEIFGKKWDAVVFDESHNMHGGKQGVGMRAQAAKDLQDASGKVLYLSATPFGGMKDLHYLSKLGAFKSDEEFVDWARRAGANVKGNTLDSVKNPSSRKPMARIAAAWTVAGMTLTRRASMEGSTSSFEMIREADLNDEQKQAFKTAEKILSLAEGFVNPMMIEAMHVGWSKQYWEVCKLDKAIEMGKKALYNDDGTPTGKQVAFFCSFRTMTHSHLRKGIPNMIRSRAEKMAQSDNPAVRARAELFFEQANRIDEVAEDLPEVTPPVDVLTEAFGGEHRVAEIHGGTTKNPAAEQDAYQQGYKRVVVATMARGGTGISLHDTTGTAPRVQINLSLPWTAREFNQVAGRSHRLGSKSETEMTWLIGDMPKEVKNASCVSERLRDLGALATGETLPKPDAAILASWSDMSVAPSDDDTGAADATKMRISEEAEDVGEEFETFARQAMEGRDVIGEGAAAREKSRASRDWGRARRAAQQVRKHGGIYAEWNAALGGFKINAKTLRASEKKHMRAKAVGAVSNKYGGSKIVSYTVPPEGMIALASKLGVSDKPVDMSDAPHETRTASKKERLVASLETNQGIEAQYVDGVYVLAGNTYPFRTAIREAGATRSRRVPGAVWEIPEGDLEHFVSKMKGAKKTEAYRNRSFYRSLSMSSPSGAVRLIVRL